jgi:fructosamine-3-kinase
MLNDIRDVIERVGLPISDDGEIRSNIHWSHHLSFWIVSGRHKYFVKIAPEQEDAALKNEARALSTVHSSLKNIAPELVGFLNHRNFSFLIMSFLDSKPLNKLSEVVRNKTLVRQWELFFDALHKVGRNKECSFDAHLMVFDQYIPDLADYIRRFGLSDLVQSLVSFDQHGDLAAPNVGYNGNTPVVYDWEDYGKVRVGGFDLAMFIGSLLNHEADQIVQLLHSSSKPQAMLRRLIEVNRLSVHEFRLLLPVYYGLFYDLKRTNGYGKKITTLAYDVAQKLLMRLSC